MIRNVGVNPVHKSATLRDRIVGIVTLDDATYEAVKRDPSATLQAVVIVALVTVAGAVNRLDKPVVWQIASPVLGMVGFVIGSWLLFSVGTRLLDARPADGDWFQMLRLSGYAECTLVVTLFQPLDTVGPVIYWPLSLWGLVLSVKAIKHVLTVGTGRAIATLVLAGIPVIATSVVIYFTFRQWGFA